MQQLAIHLYDAAPVGLSMLRTLSSCSLLLAHRSQPVCTQHQPGNVLLPLKIRARADGSSYLP